MKSINVWRFFLILLIVGLIACRGGAPSETETTIDNSAASEEDGVVVADDVNSNAGNGATLPTAVPTVSLPTPVPTDEPPPTPTETSTPQPPPTPEPTATASSTLEPATPIPAARAVIYNTAFIFDASGSMLTDMGGITRLAAAKTAVGSLSGALPSTMNASLWAYGHRVGEEDKPASCLDIEEVIPMGEVDPDLFQATANSLEAKGWTPITTSLGEAAATLPVGPNYRNTIVLISDGEETCAGDPCALAAQLAASEAQVTIHAIGLDVDSVTRSQLVCIAEAANGTYFDAEDAEGLEDALIGAAVAAADETLGVVDNLGAPLVIRVSPDGRHLYMLSSADEVVVFARDSATGRLTYGGRIAHATEGVDGMKNPTDLAISPDGNQVYVTGVRPVGNREPIITVFNRNAESGELTFIQAAEGFDEWVRNQSNGITGLAVSQDGRHVYAIHNGASRENTIGIFSRDPASGMLTELSRLRGSDPENNGLLEVLDIAVSPDGKTVYVSGWNKMFGVYARDETTGLLTQIQTFENKVDIQGLLGGIEVEVSADNRHVYLVTSRGGGVNIFARDLESGLLTFVRQISDDAGDVRPSDGSENNLYATQSIAVAPDGQSVYVGSENNNFLVGFSRESSTGDLFFVEDFQDDTEGVDGLENPITMVVSPDGRHFYVGALYDQSLSVYERNPESSRLVFIEQIRSREDE